MTHSLDTIPRSAHLRDALIDARIGVVASAVSWHKLSQMQPGGAATTPRMPADEARRIQDRLDAEMHRAVEEYIAARDAWMAEQ